MINMKKVILICVFVLTMLFIGCQSNTYSDNSKNDEDNKSIDVNNYEIYEEEYIANNKENIPFSVKYLQISGLGNENLENYINQTLKLSMTEWINENCEWMNKFKADVKYKTPQYLSLCYTIEWENTQGSDYPSTLMRLGVTIDMQTGERVYLEDLIKDSIGTTSLKQRIMNFTNGISPPIDSKEADKIIHEASMSEKKYYEEEFQTNSDVYNELKGVLLHKSSFYLQENTLVITRNEYEYDDIYINFKQ